MIPNPSNPQAWNRFGYVHNRPINFNDPSGHIDCPVGNTPSDCGLAGGLVDMLVLALFFHVESIVLKSNVVNMIEKDPGFRDFQSEVLMEKVYKDSRYYEEDFNFTTDDFTDDQFNHHLGGDRSPTDMLMQFMNPNIADNSNTWAVAKNPLTWMVRNGYFYADGHVSKNGEITITYTIADRFDLRPDWERRSLAYNIATSILGGLWHDTLGASEPYVEAKWEKIIKPNWNPQNMPAGRELISY